MYKKKLKKILEKVSRGLLGIDDAMKSLKYLPYDDIGYAMVDHHRTLRRGYPEAIFAEGKSIKQIKGITKNLMEKNSDVLITRADFEVYQAIKSMFDDAVYYGKANMIVLKRSNSLRKMTTTRILIVGAGTSDLGVCEEAAVTAETMGSKVQRLYDVGVSGMHRLLLNTDKIESSSVIVVVAGMDGVLPSVVAGLTDKPVIAVPTSVGYGTNFAGVAPLLTMLNSCSSGVTVVNIDNGFGAGYSAAIINKIADIAAAATAFP